MTPPFAAFGMDLGLFARIWGTHLTWHQGFPARARARADEIVRVAAELGHPFTQTITLAYAAMLSPVHARRLGEVGRLAQATIAHATEHGFPYYLAWAQRVGRLEPRRPGRRRISAVPEIHDGIGELRTTARLRLPYYRSLLAEACGRTGRPDEGLEVLAEAFEDVREHRRAVVGSRASSCARQSVAHVSQAYGG